ncbi:hypothetical protein Tter_2383 [Thermobaculum terrenum ATCC BAA-798]|uniref:Uncharacterized protein n=1 Tax=Thermobaculum terrenum (strain ATCC BAA-798 / CCMEE 7001 / YNP1) TaxID=525904 RepID=D1CHQ9_THET1|nr:ABC transporter ATP-binding protein [Thermobaculum terrenum]ACZ43280.1 hypothetical protein Tter_2383 [Thermobaculum terrenum ATCC BAA-798]
MTLLTRIDRRLYLLEEPTSGVDPTSRLRILGRLQRLVEDGRSCLVSTHQPQDLRYVDAHLICHEARLRPQVPCWSRVRVVSTVSARCVSYGLL